MKNLISLSKTFNKSKAFWKYTFPYNAHYSTSELKEIYLV